MTVISYAVCNVYLIEPSSDERSRNTNEEVSLKSNWGKGERANCIGYVHEGILSHLVGTSYLNYYSLNHQQ